ncbi:TRL-like family protein [Leptospira fletcheri]|uniref:TRL-like family protein n=1 Tax=Leptospira fletcheri TaxID=2484981 RepID=A0A4R9GJ69_9LEPT|nr:TRL domain-containing protein [Leptospira fletcheri]TGK13153.1 TRL-like family protein [Leptospira fletcheri]
MFGSFFSNFIRHSVLFLLFSWLSACSGTNVLTLVSADSSTHPFQGDANPLQSVFRGEWIYRKQRETSGFFPGGDTRKESVVCSHSIFSLVGWGDSSLEEAFRKEPIQKIAYVEYSQETWLSGILYHSFCTRIVGE